MKNYKIIIKNDNTIDFNSNRKLLDGELKLDVSNETYSDLCSRQLNTIWKYNRILKDFYVEQQDSEDDMRNIRNSECFALIDEKSQLWWLHLSEAQKLELNTWYEAWLKVTETFEIPEKPEWLH